MNNNTLQDKVDRNTKLFKVGTAFLAAAFLFKALVTVFEDTIIVYAGIRAFNTLSTITMIIFAIAAIGVLITFSLMMVSITKLKKQEAISKADEPSGPVLKVRGELDPVLIKNNLISESEKWMASVSGMHSGEAGELNAALTGVRETMVQMDDYQLRLKNLLDSNGAEALRDTEEVLDRVEQHICRNVRKLLNIMTVSSPNTANDIDVIKLTAGNCAKDNNRLLGTTKEFLVAVTEFLNSQGDEGSSINEVEVYKKALASQIEEGGIY